MSMRVYDVLPPHFCSYHKVHVCFQSDEAPHIFCTERNNDVNVECNRRQRHYHLSSPLCSINGRVVCVSLADTSVPEETSWLLEKDHSERAE